MIRHGTLLACVFLLLMLPSAGASETEARARFDEAMEHFSRSDFEAAALRLRRITDSPTAEALHPKAFYRLGRTRLAQQDRVDARRIFAHVMTAFPAHQRFSDARYHRARPSFNAGQHERATVECETFIRNDPNSPFIADAWYRAGETLLALGRREEARSVFEVVIRDFPTGFRVEAAHYRSSLIDLGEREEQLLLDIDSRGTGRP